MKRRTFLQSSLISSAALAGLPAAAVAAEKPREYYVLRSYSLKDSKKSQLGEYLKNALLPAAARAGSSATGVFAEKLDGENLVMHVLLVFAHAGAAATLAETISTDAEYRKAAADFLAAPAADPVYDRIESSLLGSIATMPKLARSDPSKPRLMNLRVYESHNERAGAKKIEMFNRQELAIFQRVGLTPVFFAETLVGSRMPNLTYMLVFPDEAARAAAWNTFRADPGWAKLKGMPEYADKEIVSRIANKVLTPEPYSEI